MEKEEKNELLKSLADAKKDKFKSNLDDNPDLKRELLIGQLRTLKFAQFGLMERKKVLGEKADSELDKYNKQREKLIKDIEKEGFEYVQDEEDDKKYKNYEM